jgi:hypothetical protein
MHLQACVVGLTKKELIGVGKAVDRAYDSRSCANMIKEGYQGVKKVLLRTTQKSKQQQQQQGRNEEWSLSSEELALVAEHREMLPSLLLMAVGFENLAPPYHAKASSSSQLGRKKR